MIQINCQYEFVCRDDVEYVSCESYNLEIIIGELFLYQEINLQRVNGRQMIREFQIVQRNLCTQNNIMILYFGKCFNQNEFQVILYNSRKYQFYESSHY
ncbi:hypothetical protein TTHERM_001043259 (macronuclear) [Tetrahymena thermophila SB210]|uniref:Uncharacterized protein n=1 Tax=Tetrahymena thermophila (strain SB210) TaxID=312017 RepID=W7WZA6_TETTS|nr:hypothetical protein TTHERM_001043259 [Tetrahymena thermophila SB210]EWS72225.1 hypothetical protein TTHERM_001043259 [Tetrahymena thermophila SB210]|eukprot:XP_012655242.1 hypothetical protein TTHERM_001043259 [Tetrahymena thermophila SB210]